MKEPPKEPQKEELCTTCGKPMNDLVATAKCMDKWVPYNWHKLVGSLRRYR